MDGHALQCRALLNCYKLSLGVDQTQNASNNVDGGFIKQVFCPTHKHKHRLTSHSDLHPPLFIISVFFEDQYESVQTNTDHTHGGKIRLSPGALAVVNHCELTGLHKQIQ